MDVFFNTIEYFIIFNYVYIKKNNNNIYCITFRFYFITFYKILLKINYTLKFKK